MKIKLFIPYKTLISYTLFILSIFVFSCAPIVQKHGYSPELENVYEAVIIGVDNEKTVKEKLGTPSTISSIGTKTWYYISSITYESRRTSQGKLIDQNILEIRFSDKGVVQEKKRYNKDSASEIKVAQTKTEIGFKRNIVSKYFRNLFKKTRKMIED